MFGSIAPRYDVTNTVLSGGVHHLWKRRVAQAIPAGGRALDLCTGTGDLLPLLEKRASFVVGGDFCRPMLEVGMSRGVRTPLVQCDALRLPFKDESFDAVTVAFGVRNFERLEEGLREILRVLKAPGTLIVLEFGQPSIPVWRELYQWYSRTLMPLVGGLLTGNRDAYAYLPETAKRFPCREAFTEILSASGFSRSSYESLTGGIAYLYRATKEQ